MAARARVQTAVISKDFEAKSADEKRLLALSKLSKDSFTMKSVTTIKILLVAPSDFKPDELLSVLKTEGVRVDSTDVVS